MVLSLLIIARLAADFTRYVIGTFQAPYETYRSLAQRADIRYLPYLGGFIMFYIALAGLAKGGLQVHPLVLSASFVRVVSAIVLTFTLSVGLLGILGGIVGGEVHWRRLTVLWAFTLIPTSIWFMAASFSSLLFPPPRTASLLGQLASALFIALSIALFLWKGILYYLTLRFGLRLSLGRIVVVSTVFVPLTIGYAFLFYRMGVFRVPFL